MSTLWHQNTTNPRDQNKWKAPDISVELSSEDYINGRDPVMQAILNYTPQPPLNNLMTDAFSTAGIVKAIKIYNEYKANETHKYKSTEALINRLGYQLMNQKNYKDAIVIFELNTMSYPQSANVWDSYAEAYMNDGQTELAIIYYNKSLDLNPQNQNAINMIKKIKK